MGVHAVRQRLSRRKRWLFIAAIWAAFAATLEVGARIYIPLRGYDLVRVRRSYGERRRHRLTRRWPEQDRDHPYLPYVIKTRPPDVKMPGLRLTSADEVKPPDVFRIFCLGGSTTYFGYPARLQRALADDFGNRGKRVEVVNAANVFYTSAESLINFALRCLHYEPDLVVVYHAVNDATASFGPTWEPDYSHFRRRMYTNEPYVWDRMPRFLDRSAAYVQVRAWFEGQENIRTWWQCINRYLPDWERDPFHGTEAFRNNLRSIIATARASDSRVLLATQVCNTEVPSQRRVQAMQAMNDATRSFADEPNEVYLVDAARMIPGNYELQWDICHFRPERDGEDRLVRTIAGAIRGRLDRWIIDTPDVTRADETKLRDVNG